MEIIPEHDFIINQIFLIGNKQIKRDESDALIKCIYGFTDRLYLSLYNAKSLILSNLNDTEILFGLSLCLRTTMVDAILCIELTQLARECSVSMDFNPLISKCLHFLSDGVNQAEGYLDRLRQSNRDVEAEHIDAVSLSMKEEIDLLYQKNQVPFVKIKNTQMRTLLVQSSHYNEYDKHFDVYYTLFSKVEHFGLIYFRWANYSIDKKEGSIYNAIRLCMIHYFNILVLFNVSGLENQFILEMVHSFRNFAGIDKEKDSTI